MDNDLINLINEQRRSLETSELGALFARFIADKKEYASNRLMEGRTMEEIEAARSGLRLLKEIESLLFEDFVINETEG